MKYLNVSAISMDPHGRVVLNDADLLAIERDFTVEPLAGAGTNAGCKGTRNDVCQNNLCGGNYNSTCVNIGPGCQDLDHFNY